MREPAPTKEWLFTDCTTKDVHMKRVLLLLQFILNFLLIFLLSCGAPQVADRSLAMDNPPARLDVQFRPSAGGQFPGEPLSCEAMELLRFTAVVTGGDGDYSYIWDFNSADGKFVDGLGPIGQYIYPEAGQYTISLHVADGSGASGEAFLDIDVRGRGYIPLDPIDLRDLVSHRNAPYIIDGCDITNPQGNGITLRNCNNVVIRNCYIHDCKTGDSGDGRAICAENCHNLTINNVYVASNERGILAEGNPGRLSSDILVEDNLVVGCEREDGISFRNVERVEANGNIVYDNGRVWEDRISGISFNCIFKDVSVHNNLVVNSNSDGIELMGDTEQETAANVEVYDNILRDNGEQGVWLFRVQNGRVHHNYILGSHNNGVCLEGWVSGIKVDHNIIVRCGGIPEMKHHGGGAVAIQYSQDNIIQCNILVDSSCGDVSISCPERYEEDWIWKMDEGFQKAAGNVVDSNVICSSEFNISIASGVSAATVTNNVVWQRGRGRNYHGFHPHESNIKGMPLFRAPERGDYTLLSNSPGFQIFCRE